MNKMKSWFLITKIVLYFYGMIDLFFHDYFLYTPTI